MGGFRDRSERKPEGMTGRGRPAIVAFAAIGVAAAGVAGSVMSIFGSVAAVQPGDVRLEFDEPTGAKPGPMAVLYHRPVDWNPQNGDIIVVLHGADRDARAMVSGWRATAQARRALLIAPEFSERKYPGARWYNFANTAGKNGLSDRSTWVFPALDRAVDAVRAATGASSRTYDLYGFSGGAQFALRMLMLGQATQARRIIAASAGWYTLPVSDRPWPCGGSQAFSDPASLARFFAANLIIQVGQRDTNPRDYFGDDGFESCSRQQGPHRLARAHYMFDQARAEAARINTPFSWKMFESPGAGHSIEELAQHAAATILPPESLNARQALSAGR